MNALYQKMLFLKPENISFSPNYRPYFVNISVSTAWTAMFLLHNSPKVLPVAKINFTYKTIIPFLCYLAKYYPIPKIPVNLFKWIFGISYNIVICFNIYIYATVVY